MRLIVIFFSHLLVNTLVVNKRNNFTPLVIIHGLKGTRFSSNFLLINKLEVKI